MLPGEDDRSFRDEDDRHHHEEEPHGWSKPEIRESEREAPWGVENGAEDLSKHERRVAPPNPVPQNPKEQWGGRAGSQGDDSQNEPPIVRVPDPEKTARSRR